MANIQERVDANGQRRYRVQIRLKGYPTQTATSDRRTDAKIWAQQTESDMRAGRYLKTAASKKNTVADMIERYRRDVLPHKSPTTRGPQDTLLRWWREKLGHLPIGDVTPAFVAEARDELVHALHHRRDLPASVCELGEYVSSVVGLDAAPDDAVEWLHIPEEYLFEITHRPVFHDGPGEATRRFHAFAQYPEDVWRKRLGTCLAWMSEWGVKHLRRAERRGDVVSANQYWSRFATSAMRVGFLLNHRYAPYHKWLFHHFRELPSPADRIASLLADGYGSDRPRVSHADEIMGLYSDQLARIVYTLPDPHPDEVAEYASEIGRYSTAVKDTIEDERIKALGAFVDVVTPPSVSTWTFVAGE